MKTKAKKLKSNLYDYNLDTKDIDQIIHQIIAEGICVAELDKLEQKLTREENEYIKKTNEYLEDLEVIKKRVRDYINRRSLRYEEDLENKILHSVIEPNEEGEVYAILYLLYILYPQEFDFNLLAYYTGEKVDCLVSIDSELFMSLNLNERFGNLYERVSDVLNDKELIDVEDKFCLLELKIRLGCNMNHSLALVSHIICWEKSGVEQITAKDDIYGFTDSGKTMLINTKSQIVKKIKVIYLKNIIEDLTSGKYS